MRNETKGEPFWGTGCDDDIFKAHPSALRAIPYKPNKPLRKETEETEVADDPVQLFNKMSKDSVWEIKMPSGNDD